MGEIADQIINGECCADCLWPFEKAHGYPDVICDECWNEKWAKTKGAYRSVFPRWKPFKKKNKKKEIG